MGVRREGKCALTPLGRPRKNTDEYLNLCDVSGSSSTPPSLHKPPAVLTQEDDEGIVHDERSPLSPGGSNRLHKASMARRLRAMSGPLSAPVSRAKVDPTRMVSDETALPMTPPVLNPERTEKSRGAIMSTKI